MTNLDKISLEKIKITLSGALTSINALLEQQKEPIVIIKKQDRINYVLDSICEYYEITREALIARHKNTVLSRRKKLALKLLRDMADITYAEAGEALGFSSGNDLWGTYKEITESLNESSYGNKELKKEYKELLKHLKA